MTLRPSEELLMFRMMLEADLALSEHWLNVSCSSGVDGGLVMATNAALALFKAFTRALTKGCLTLRHVVIEHVL